LGPSVNDPDAPQPWAYCATLKCSFSSDSAALCLLCRSRGHLLRLCLFLLVRQADSQKVVALTSQRLAAANNMLHCFGLLPVESAGWIPIKQAHSIQVPSYRGMSREDGNSQSQEMSTEFKQVGGSFLTWFVYEKLTRSMTWQISPGSMVLILSPVLYCCMEMLCCIPECS
jgi:hypothetical protein